ncbi:hypothetical protein ONE63_009305 [Megalurothrips usitatus]|uniref:Uncharacterized protein n=1 Tax=Megalurothrips usitatus TaxID=439358 RepID=A0AAV7XND6_9NEOP|nr:hypothetical protein ONE63_009305 [Megalurothrips usitatus]
MAAAGAAAGAAAPGKRWARLRHRDVDPTARSDGEETVVSAATAVLFATGQGLHLRTLDPRWGVESEDADDVSTWVAGGARGGRGGGGGPSDSSFPPAPVGPWAADSQPRYVFQFCDLAVIEDLPKYSPEASTAVATIGLPAVLGDADTARRRKVIRDADDGEPSLTREELQASLAKPRSIAHSLRKNVRFASVVSEIPLTGPLSSVAEVDVESGVWSDPTSSSSTTTASASSEADSPVRYARPRTRSIELALVSGELLPAPKLPKNAANHNHHPVSASRKRTSKV